MISPYKRISKITDELINYFFTIGATNINVRINEQLNQFEIHLTCNYDQKHVKKIRQLIKYLNTEKQIEMEECYWELAGDICTNNELALIGMMTDEVNVTKTDDTLDIKLYRSKE
ncbi:MAG TPA: hypothetical protein DCY20_09280 [Firmicutes bacterium]|nr:hypothetical protein [Bacillota bacterium]